MRAPIRTGGFTLVELSIVLVIIGLIVGGVLVGTDMIKGAQIRAVVSEMEKYQTAINAFRGKFNAVPGDYKSATATWPSAGTTNGNGNLEVDTSGWTEPYRAWQHLSLAGMIEGQYTGTVANWPLPQPNVEIPPSRYNASMGYYLVTASAGASDVYGGVYGLILQFGLPASWSPILTNGFPAKDAYAIDKKIDDGVAYSGRIRGSPGSGPNACTVAPAYDYHMTTTSLVGCSLLYKLQD